MVRCRPPGTTLRARQLGHEGRPRRAVRRGNGPPPSGPAARRRPPRRVGGGRGVRGGRRHSGRTAAGRPGGRLCHRRAHERRGAARLARRPFLRHRVPRRRPERLLLEGRSGEPGGADGPPARLDRLLDDEAPTGGTRRDLPRLPRPRSGAGPGPRGQPVRSGHPVERAARGPGAVVLPVPAPRRRARASRRDRDVAPPVRRGGPFLPEAPARSAAARGPAPRGARARRRPPLDALPARGGARRARPAGAAHRVRVAVRRLPEPEALRHTRPSSSARAGRGRTTPTSTWRRPRSCAPPRSTWRPRSSGAGPETGRTETTTR